MNRRDLLKASLLGGAAALGTASAQQPAPAPDAGAKPKPLDLPFEWSEATFAQLQAAMSSSKVTSEQLTKDYLRRIEAIDPKLHSILAVNGEAPAEAAALDAERRQKGARGPLHGIPIVLKDNIETAGKLGCTAGSLALEGVACDDAFIAARLKVAGAVILGKSNLSEWANIRSSRSISGWSAKGGLCKNPYALDRSALGSSSGSGAATAANLCAASIGTETNGSIIAPSSVHACVGVKPTVGLVSRTGIVPISPTQDTAGPICRTVTDAATLLNVIAAVDNADAATKVKDRVQTDYLAALKPDALKGVRLGVMRKLVGGNEQVTRLFDAALEVLKAQGAVLVDGLELPDPGDAQLELLLFELKAAMADYFTKRRTASPHKSLKDLIAFNEKNADKEMPYFRQELFVKAEKKGPLTDPAYLKAKKACADASRTKGIDALLKKNKLSALVGSAFGPTYNIDLLNGDPSFPGNDGYGGSHPAMAGYPSLSVPMGDAMGLPVGLLFCGPAWSEAKLLSYAFAYEQVSPKRRIPSLRETIALP